MLNSFFDDSGTHVGSGVVAVGGLIGTPEQWAKFSMLWSAKLLAPLPGKSPLRKFHLSTCNAGVDEFVDYSRTERDALMHDFREIITNCDLIGTSSAIDVGAWDELITGKIRLHYGSALEMCVQSCADEAIKIAGKHPAGDRISLSFDRGIQTHRLEEVLLEFTLPLGRPRVVKFDFLDVRDTPALQGADIIATENYWHATATVHADGEAAPRPHFQHFLARARTEGLFLGRPEIEALCEAARELDLVDGSIDSPMP